MNRLFKNFPVCESVLMKLLWLIVSLTLALSPPAKAVSGGIEILPEQAQKRGIAIISARLPNGDVRFTVEIPLVEPFQTEDLVGRLSNVTIGATRSSYNSIRNLPGEMTTRGIQYNFTVTEKELEDPNLSFRWSRRLKNGQNWGSFRFQFARLQNFLKP
jgi:hypothetical protein